MPRPLWPYIDGGPLIAIGDYVLTEDANVELDQREITLARPHAGWKFTSIHLKAKQISHSFLSLRSAPENPSPNAVDGRSRGTGRRMRDGQRKPTHNKTMRTGKKRSCWTGNKVCCQSVAAALPEPRLPGYCLLFTPL